MAVIRLLFILLLLPALAQADILRLRTSTSAGSLIVDIRYQAGKKNWARYLASKIPAYMRAAEKYFGQPLPEPRKLTIYGCRSCQSQLMNRRIWLQYSDSEIGNPSLLFHELTHLWLGYQWGPGCQEWLMEGGCSFVPLAMSDAGMLRLSARDKHELLMHWGYYSDHAADVTDNPLCPTGWEDKRLRYIKTFKLHKILYESLGHKKYRTFLRRVLSKRPRNNTVVLRILNGVKTADWQDIMSGWVFDGSYNQVSFDDFLVDSDADGLLQAEEKLFGTDTANPDSDGDLLPDGAEKKNKRNPLVQDADAVSFIQARGPFIDGSEVEWDYLSFTSATEPSGDSTSGSWADLTGLKYFVRGSTLYLSVSTLEPVQAEENIFFDTLFDLSNDGYTDQEAAFFLQYPAWAWHYDVAAESSELPYNLTAARGSTIEMAIPLSILGTYSGSPRILPIIRNDSSKVNYDYWDEWLELVL